ncbi:MAG: restriction endonuclease fold toxin 5 domain-containing protein [Pseudomonadota bacterium]
MAGLATNLLRSAAGRVAAALGAGAAVGTGVALKRQEEAERAKDSTLALVDAQSHAKTNDCTKEEKCKDCPPDRGIFREQNTSGWSEASILYQVRIGGMTIRPGFIMEWLYNGVSFDGFDSSQCLLKEAKAKHDQFFDMWGTVLTFWEKGAERIIDEAMRQGVAAAPRPPTRLRWHFMEPVSYRFFSLVILAAHPDVEVVFQP